jgi:hypothetical protein
MLTVKVAIEWNNGKAYFFEGKEYLRFDIATDRADPDYPKPIAGNWPGLWPRDIDTAVNWGNSKAYFFKGGEYLRYDIAADHTDPGYPKPITGAWPGLWPGDIDAAVNWGNGKAYFFKGSEYLRYDIAADRTDPSYPKPIAGAWPGLWSSDIDAVVNWGNGKAYFFKGEEYLRYDIAADRTDPGYPLPITGNWNGLGAPPPSVTTILGAISRIPSPILTVLKTTLGLTLPTAVRRLNATEESVAKRVYGASLDYSEILVSDGGGAAGSAVTTAVPTTPMCVVLNVGGSFSTGVSSNLLVHELGHVWQSQHHNDRFAFMSNSVGSQVKAKALRQCAYCYIPGKAFGEYAAEQAAEQAEDEFKKGLTGPMITHMAAQSPHTHDPSNEAGLNTFRHEKRGAPGVLGPPAGSCALCSD